jgi:ABC-type transporter Mla subunit MlaD
MSRAYNLDGRGATNRQLLIYGLVVLLLSTVVTLLLLAKSTGRLEPYTRVVADLNNVGDGLPRQSDVRYHGLLVGSVNRVVPASNGNPNFVHIDVKREYAGSIPRTVTARVVPSNIFAVSSLQLIDSGEAGPPISTGTHILEDTELPTVLFQTTITKLRDILTATGRGREDNTVGILAAIGAATDSRRGKLLAAGAQLDRILKQLNDIVATDTGPSTLSALVDAAGGLRQTAPDLLDALHTAVRPMQTLAEQRGQLNTLLAGGINTVGTSHTALANHTDRLVTITGHLTPVAGVLADTSHNWLPGFLKLHNLSNKFFDEVWIPEVDTANMRANLSLTPSYSYTRADCPQYGELKGPSCFTAPLIAVRPDLPEVLMPQNYQPPKDLMPPPGTVLGPEGNLVAVGPPLINPHPNLIDPNPPLPPGMAPAPPVPGTANPALAPPPAPAPAAPAPAAPAPAPAPAPGQGFPAEAAPASYGGNVGPIGSPQERNQLGVITGQPVSTATQLLLGPVVRGTTVSLAEPAPSSGGR